MVVLPVRLTQAPRGQELPLTPPWSSGTARFSSSPPGTWVGSRRPREWFVLAQGNELGVPLLGRSDYRRSTAPPGLQRFSHVCRRRASARRSAGL